ncbi:ionotropic receptor 75a-like isoform X2 [Leptopilina boulardi]|uniref:ionotropic receptor 75a-like isoform X2 n=1 Tax=Leptopilina boulardi TaxID=63433 RepID=UPI0021F59203|nr:ionotropic receptor 75a-like isoform X2 [Leptopilina boulardi]
MRFFLLLSLLLVKKIRTDENKIIIDYFIYKKVSSVVGFHCNWEKNAVQLIKLFNTYGITAMVINWNASISVSKLFNNLHWKLGGFVDMRCRQENDIKYLFKEASKEELFKNLNTWLVLSKNLTQALKVVNDTSFSITTDFMIGILDYKKILFYDVYNHCKYRGGILNVSFAGNWNKNIGLNISITKESISRRWNFHGMILKMTGLINYRPKDKQLAEYLQDYSTKTLDTIGKFGYALWLHVSEIFNFTIEAGEFTEWMPNDTNGPMISALGRREIDLAGIPASVTDDRLNYVFPPATPWLFSACFVFRNPESKNIKVNQFLSPFSTECWYLTAIMTLLVSVLFSITLTLENIATCLERYKISLLTTYGTICQQGSEFCPESPASRIGFLTIGIFSLLTFNFYSAYLVSARLNEPMIKMNDSLYSLSKSNLKVASEPLIYLNFYLKISKIV